MQPPLPATGLDIQSLEQAYRSRALTPRQVIDQVLERIDAAADRHIWISLRGPEAIRQDADRLSQLDPQTLPLYGLPFAIKDNIDLAGVATTCACPAYRRIPERSAFVVERLVAAGAIPIGKTNLDQFATGLTGTRSPYGVCANSFDRRYIAGGSSSGSAVAVALGLVSFALGTDTAGSGRVPAAFNNLVGLKPTRGLLSCSGVVPACRSLDCVSIFALTADDAARVFETACACDPEDAYARKPQAGGQRFGGGFRFGVPRADQLEFCGDRDAAGLFETCVHRLEALGGTAVPIEFGPFLEAARLLYEGPWVAERYLAVRDIIERTPEALHPVTRAVIEPAAARTAVEVFEAEHRLATLKRQADGILDKVDCILTPTAATLDTIAAVEADPIGLNTRLGYYTNFMNLLDYAAVAVPAGFRPGGLPFGVTLFAPAFRDRPLLDLAARLQQSYGLPLGATGRPLPAGGAAVATNEDADAIRIVVCGAHMSGLPLNRQLTERGATLVARTRTAPGYRLYALGGAAAGRPGLIRDDSSNDSIEVEVWSMPETGLGSLVRLIPSPLGLGTIRLGDGSAECGFLCEAWALQDAIDITHLGGWRAYLAGRSGT